MTTFDLAEQLSISEQKILNYIDNEVPFDWKTITPVRFENTYLISELQAEKILIHFNN